MTTKTQQKKNRKAWTTALRSGEYKQGKGNLEKDGAFCCLGVLCKLSGIERKDWGNGTISYGGDTAGAREAAREWIGLSTESGNFEDAEGNPNDLIGLNDTQGWTFQQIAELIDSEPKGMFD